MPTHDIIDNRNGRRIDHINQMFGKNEWVCIERMVQDLYGMTFGEITLVDGVSNEGVRKK
jgi:hypothetical protein